MATWLIAPSTILSQVLTTVSLLLVAGGAADGASSVPADPAQHGSCSYRKWERPGTVKLLVVAGVHGPEGGRCGALSPTHFQLLVALDWMVSIVNGNRSHGDPVVPGINIGYDVYDNCDNADVTTDLLYAGVTAGLPLTCPPTTVTQSAPYIGTLLLTDVESSRTAARLLEPSLVLRPLSSSPALDSATDTHTAGTNNLLLTAPAFQDEMNAILQLLKKKSWNFIALVTTDDEYGTSGSRAFPDLARSHGICINSHRVQRYQNAGVDVVASSSETIITQIYTDISRAYQKSMAVVYLGHTRGAVDLLEEAGSQDAPVGSRLSWLFSSTIGRDRRLLEKLNAFPDVTVFTVDKSYMDMQEFNEYFTDTLKQETSSHFSTLISEYKSIYTLSDLDDRYIGNLVEVVLTLAAGLRSLHNRTCTGDGLCSELADIITTEILGEIKTATIHTGHAFLPEHLPDAYIPDKILSFLDDGHISVTGEFMLQLYTFQKANLTYSSIGTYDSGVVTFTSSVSQEPPSACNQPADCVLCRHDLDLKFSYLPGDVFLLGLFSIRQYGDSPYTCGEYRRGTHDVITVSSFMQSILTMREKTGINFGGIAIDDCYSAFNTSAFLTDLFSGRVTITEPSSGDVIDVGKVFVIIGALSSPVSIIIADQATALGIPMISYGASSPELGNRGRYPYFLRTVPSDQQQVRGMVSLIAQLNVSHIGAIYIDDTYGQNGLRELVAMTKTYHICMEEPLAVTQQMSNASLRAVIQKIYETQARVVVYFSIDSIAVRLLDILATNFEDKDPLVFIASEAWGTNQNLIEGRLGEKAKGSLVFNIATRTQNDVAYKSYLQALTSERTDFNRWTPRFFEDVYECDFIDSFDKTHVDRNGRGKICDGGEPLTLPAATVESLYEDQRGIHVMHAVQAAGHGFRVFAPTVCGGTIVCVDLRSRTGGLVDEIKTFELEGSEGRFKPFTSSGEGNIGYSIYNIRRQISAIDYVQVGSYNKDGHLELHSPVVFYNDRDTEDTLTGIFGYEIECSNFCRDDGICRSVTVPPSSTTPPSTPAPQGDTGSDSTMLVTTVVFGALLGVLAVALVLVIVALLRRGPSPPPPSDTSTYKDTGHGTSIPSTLSEGSPNIYDVPGHISNGRGPGRHVRSSSNPAAFSSSVNTKHESLSSLPIQYAYLQNFPTEENLSHRLSPSVHGASPASHRTGTSPASQRNGNSPAFSRISGASSNNIPSNQTYMVMQNPQQFVQSAFNSAEYKKYPGSSPRFRYPNTNRTERDESHYTLPNTDDSVAFRRQRPVVAGYRVDTDSVFVREPAENPDPHPVDRYLASYPNSNVQISPKEGTITYLTAKDFVNNEDEEEFAPSTPVAAAYIHPISVPHDDYNPDTAHASSSDSEVATINLSAHERGSSINYTNNASPDQTDVDDVIKQMPTFESKSSSLPRSVRKKQVTKTDHTQERRYGSDSTVGGGQPRTTARSSLTEVPDIIRHGVYDVDDDEVIII